MILKKLLGEILISMGFVTSQQLNEALQRQHIIIKEEILLKKVPTVSLVSDARLTADTDKPPMLGQILIDMGYATTNQLERALKEQDRSISVYKFLENEKLGAAIEMCSLVSSSLNLAKVLHLIMKNVNRVTNSVASTLMLLDEETGELVFSVPTGPKADELTDIRLPPGKGIAGWVAKLGKPALVPCVDEDPRFYPKIDDITGLETKSIVCVPLKSRAKLIGVLEVINKVDGTPFTENDVLLLSIFGFQAAAAIENARLHGELNARLQEQQKAREALRESEEKYCQIFENEEDAITIADLETMQFLDVNPAAEALYGYTRDEFLTMKITALSTEEEKTAGIVRQLADQRVVRVPVQHHKTKDRTAVIVESTCSSYIWQNRKVICTIARDITDRIRAEEEKEKMQAQLQRAQKMEAVGLMAGGIAHDLNNILSGIVTYPELLLMDLSKDNPLTRPIKTIQESGLRAADVVADLLTVARGVASSKEVLNLNVAVKEYLDSPEHSRLKGFHSFVTFKTHLDPGLLNVNGSPSHIKKTLINLVTNASEAIEGGGTVTISTENRYLDQPLRGYEHVHQGEYAVLSVLDDGSGVSPKDLERIFEPFYTKRVMGRTRTGLGLAAVWNTVQDHEGYINIRSGEEGTVFELYFPVTREEVSAAKKEVSVKDYLGHGEKVLVVDDEERQREIACELLNKLSYSPEAVSSGEEAVEYIKEQPVDLIVLDMIMPEGMNGRETYEKIIKIRPGQKAIIASGFSETDEVKIAQKLGAGKYIKKPYTFEKMGLAVKEELEK